MSQIQIQQAEPVINAVIDGTQAALDRDTFGLMEEQNQPKREPKLVIGLNADKLLDK